jgi:hypothetical protein
MADNDKDNSNSNSNQAMTRTFEDAFSAISKLIQIFAMLDQDLWIILRVWKRRQGASVLIKKMSMKTSVKDKCTRRIL